MKKSYLLYLDARPLSAERNEEILSATRAGFPIIMATPNPRLYQSYPIDYIIETQVGNYDVSEREILLYLKKHKLAVNGILFWKDGEVELGARLSKALNLPGNTIEAAQNVRNKTKTRTILNRIKNANPKYAVIKNEQHFKKYIQEIGVPSMLKPAGNSGSRGIFKINPSSKIPDIYHEFKSYNNNEKGDMFRYYNDCDLLEEELSGTEHSVAGLIMGDVVVITGIADKKFNRNLFLQYQNIIPSSLPENVQEEIASLTRKAIKLAGLTCGGFHVDIMVCKEGLKILEIGGRLGGELINSHLIPLAYAGFSPYKALIQIAQGKKVKIPPDLYKNPLMRVGAHTVLASQFGTINHIAGLEKICKHPSVRLFFQMHGPGDLMHKPRDKFKACEIACFVAQYPLSEDIEGLLNQLDNEVAMIIN